MASIVEIILKGNDQSAQALQSATRGISSLQSVAKQTESAFAGLWSTIAGFVSVGAIVALGRSALQMGDELAHATEKFGIGAEKLSVLRYAANLADVDFQGLGKALKFMAQNASLAATGSADSGNAFKAMGISVRDSSGHLKASADLFQEVATKMASYRDSTEKTALVLKVFGRAGADIIPVLNSWGTASAKLTTEAEKLGLIFSDEQAKKLEQYEQEIKKVEMRTKSWAASVVLAVTDANNAYNAAGGNMFGRKWNATQTGKIADILVANPDPAKTTAPLVDKEGTKLLDAALKKIAEEALRAENVLTGLFHKSDDAATAFQRKGLSGLEKELQTIDDESTKLVESQLEAWNAGAISAAEYTRKTNDAAKATAYLKEEAKRIYEIEVSRLRVQKESADWSESMAAEMGYDMGGVTEAVLMRDKQLVAEGERGLRLYADAWEYVNHSAKGYQMDVQQTVLDSFKKLEDTIVNFAMTGKANFQDFTNSVIANLMKIAIQASITAPLYGAFSSIFSSATPAGTTSLSGGNYSLGGNYSFGGARASGGPVSFSSAYLVGERGPELFVPGSSGNIVPNGGAKQSVSVQVINESGTPLKVRDTRASFDAQEMVVTLWMDAANRNRFGLRNMLGGV